MKTMKPVFFESEAGFISNMAGIERLQKTRWLVDGMIPQTSITWLYGPPKSMKSFVVMDIAAAVATGQEWMGRKTSRGVALYLAAEGGDDVALRKLVIDTARGQPSAMTVRHAMPQIDTEAGFEFLLSTLWSLLPVGWCNAECAAIEQEAQNIALRLINKALTDEDKEALNVEHDIFGVLFDDFTGFKNPDDMRQLFKSRMAELEGEDAALWDNLNISGKTCSGFSRELESLLKATGLDDKSEDGESKADQFLSECPVLLVVDTYAYTAADDEKRSVSAYTRNLRRLVDLCNGRLSVIVVDHATKAGTIYMGSLAKEGNSDVMIEVERDGSISTLHCIKLKQAAEFDPIHVEMKPMALEGLHDTEGRPLSSLYPTDGSKAYRLAELSGGGTESHATSVLRIISQSGGSIGKASIRDEFVSERVSAGAKRASATQAFRRALENLIDDGLIIEVENGTIEMAVED